MADEEAQVEQAAGATAFGSSEFESLLQKEFRPKSDQAKTAVESAVKTLAEQALVISGGLQRLSSGRIVEPLGL